MSTVRLTPLIILIVAIVSVPVSTQAAIPPRVVTLAELAAKAVDVTISGKHLTLIHFETGEVTMVAVGDPDIVNVTVKGPDVLLKALASTGSTNAFIWQAGRYTQWIFTVRQNTKDPRLIIVKDLAAVPSDEPTNKRTSRQEEDGRATSDWALGSTAPSLVVTGAAGNTSTPLAIVPAPPDVLSPQPVPNQAVASDACGKRPTLDQFVRTLTPRQRELFGMFLREPDLTKIQALLRDLTVQQRRDLVAFLSGPDDAAQSARALSDAERPAPSVAGAERSDQSASAPIQNSENPEAKASSGVPVAFTVTPDVVGDQLFFSYRLANEGQSTLLADILRLRVLDARGNRLAFRINRVSRDGSIGRLEPNGVEYGVISVNDPAQVVALEWKLVTLGSGIERLVRIEAPVP